MGVFSLCPVCGSDWCSGAECIRISPANLRVLADNLPNSGHVGDLRSLADYLEGNPVIYAKAIRALIKGDE